MFGWYCHFYVLCNQIESNDAGRYLGWDRSTGMRDVLYLGEIVILMISAMKNDQNLGQDRSTGMSHCHVGHDSNQHLY